MVKATVLPIKTVNVKINQDGPKIVHGTSTFVGASENAALIQQAYDAANSAITIANSVSANLYLKLDKAGGEITGNLIVDEVFTATVDGGRF